MPRTVRAVGRDSVLPDIPDVAFVTLRYDSGLVANVELSWLAPSKLRRTVIVGSGQMVVYDDSATEPVRLYDHGVDAKNPDSFGEHHLSYRTGDILSPKIETHEPLSKELEDFVLTIRNGGETEASASLASEVVRLTEAADRSLRQGGKEVEIATPDRWPAIARAAPGEEITQRAK
jgi:predicted dehydrogenase